MRSRKNIDPVLGMDAARSTTGTGRVRFPWHGTLDAGTQHRHWAVKIREAHIMSFPLQDRRCTLLHHLLGRGHRLPGCHLPNQPRSKSPRSSKGSLASRAGFHQTNPIHQRRHLPAEKGSKDDTPLAQLGGDLYQLTKGNNRNQQRKKRKIINKAITLYTMTLGPRFPICFLVRYPRLDLPLRDTRHPQSKKKGLTGRLSSSG